MTDQTRDADAELRLTDAAMHLAAEHGWATVTLSAAAMESGLTPSQAVALAGSKRGLLTLLSRIVDREVMDGGHPDSEDSVRDRLFDLIMRRFDALSGRRAGLLAVLRTLPGDPIAAFGQILAVEASMRQTLDLAGVATDGLLGELKVRAATVVYLLSLRTWTKDNSEDLGPTMAALDRHLQQAEQLATMVHRRRPAAGSSDDSGEAAGADDAAGAAAEASGN